jgi:hypothetical protein
MSSSESFPKLLPYTTFVLSCVYYTRLFTIDHWKLEIKRDKDATFLSVVERHIDSSFDPTFPSQVKHNLLYLASKVDQLEEALSQNNLRRDDFGLGRKQARPIHTLATAHVRPYFITILLDRLLWASTPGFVPPTMTAYLHPHVLEQDLDRPTSVHKYIRLSDSAQLTELLTNFGIDVELAFLNPLPILRDFARPSSTPSPSPSTPSPSPSTTPGPDWHSSRYNMHSSRDNVHSSRDNEYEPTRYPTLQEPARYQSTLISQSVNMNSFRNVFQAGANMAYLAASALFLINVCFVIELPIIVD